MVNGLGMTELRIEREVVLTYPTTPSTLNKFDREERTDTAAAY
jgi:hypothetical protein